MIETLEAKSMEDVRNIVAGVYVEVEEAWGKLDWRPWLGNQINAVLERWESDYYTSQTDPFTEAWEPLRPSTRKRKGHDTILVDTDRMRASLVGRTGDSVIDVIQDGMQAGLTRGTSVEYAGFHQTGTERMAQRIHVGLNEDKADQLAEFAADEAVRLILEALA